MKIHRDLLFHHGHIANVKLAQALAEPVPPHEGAAEDAAQAKDAPERKPATAADPAAARRKWHARLIRSMTALSPFR